jgi:hypothetical protein
MLGYRLFVDGPGHIAWRPGGHRRRSSAAYLQVYWGLHYNTTIPAPQCLSVVPKWMLGYRLFVDGPGHIVLFISRECHLFARIVIDQRTAPVDKSDG